MLYVGWDGWMDVMVIIGHRSFKSTFGPNNFHNFQCIFVNARTVRVIQVITGFFNVWQRALMLQRITRSKSHCKKRGRWEGLFFIEVISFSSIFLH